MNSAISPIPAAVTREELSCVRRILRSWADASAGPHQFARQWLSHDRQVFVVTEETFQAKAALLTPLLPSFHITWMDRRGVGRVCILAGSTRSVNQVVDSRLSQFVAYRRRRSREKSAPGFYHPEHVEILWGIQEGRCYFSNEVLGSSFADAVFQLDHLWPLAARFFHPAFGTNWPTNLALVTRSINSAKGSRDAATFLSEVRRKKSFVPRPTKERNQIDRLRIEAFREFMTRHCSADENDWYC